MRLFIYLYILSMAVSTAFAQEPSDDHPVSATPREKIVEEINIAPDNAETESIVSQILLELRGSSENDNEEDTMPEEAVEEPLEDSAEISQPLAPFYLSPKEYIALRGDDTHDQLILDYEVTTGALGEDQDAQTEAIRLILGPDYVSVKRPESQQIFDFKLNRFLEIKTVATPEDENKTTRLFDNISLFAKAYRNISTVKQATQNGQKRRLQVSEDLEIDSFWLESSMSWAAAKLEKPLKIKSTKSNLLAIWDDVSVVSASFSDEAYEDNAFKNSLFAYAHHAWPIHPKILVEFYTHDTPPETLEMVSFGPAKPKGQWQKWTLQNREIGEREFPLPLDGLSAVERRPISPLVFVISEAVNNRALGGRPDLNAISSVFWKAEADGDVLTQWLAGQQYNSYSGTCQKEDEDPICTALSELSDTHKFAAIGSIDPKAKILSDFINGSEMAKVKKNRASALNALQPYLNDATTPAYILRVAAMARASMKKSDAKKSGVSAIQADAVLKQALAKDPYDPHTYLGLAQVYAANGAYEQSWDIYDVLRAAIPMSDAVDLKIDEAESKLKSTSPGYFLPN